MSMFVIPEDNLNGHFQYGTAAFGNAKSINVLLKRHPIHIILLFERLMSDEMTWSVVFCFASGPSLQQFLRACCLPAALPAATASTVLECSHPDRLFTLSDMQLMFTGREEQPGMAS